MIEIYAQEAKNIKDKIIGLIGKDKPIALMLKTHFGIHTFGLKFPIDILILDHTNKVIALKENLKPNRIFLWNPFYEKVLELPEGTIQKEKIKKLKVIDLKLN